MGLGPERNPPFHITGQIFPNASWKGIRRARNPHVARTLNDLTRWTGVPAPPAHQPESNLYLGHLVEEYDMSPAYLKDFLHRLKEHNQAGQMVTFSREKITWERWCPYVLVHIFLFLFFVLLTT